MPIILPAIYTTVLSVIILMGCTTVAQSQALRGSLFSSKPIKASVSPSSVFIGRDEGGMFADLPAHEPVFKEAITGDIPRSDLQLIRAIIQEAESRHHGYDAVQYGARIKPRKKPTRMTLNEIFAWIDATPGQPHAIGRYQFVPDTLRRVVAKTGVSKSQRFGPKVQDQLADVLLAEAGIHQFQKGAMSRTAFMNNLAKIWAGLPNSSGKSHYDGYAGNKASMSWARFDALIKQIEPRRG